MTPQRILLATDLSPRCDRATDRALMLAREWNATLDVLHVMGTVPVPAEFPWRQPETPLEAAERRVRRDLVGAEGLDVNIVITRGDPAPVILEEAKLRDTDLIVTGIARYETLGRALLGTTVDKLLRKTPVPVLVVKSRPRDMYRNVVVASDFSDHSRLALETALTLLPAAAVTVFHAAEVAYDGLVDNRDALRESALGHARIEAESFLASIPTERKAGRVIETLCEYGEPGELLSNYVLDRDVDLLVVGTKGRSAIAGALLGSVAQRLLAVVPADVLAVRGQTD